MKLEIKIEDHATPYLQRLIAALPKQAAEGITALANDARNEFIKDLPNRMTLRTSWYKPGNQLGFNMRKATASNPVAEIYTRAPFMERQEVGGKRTPRNQHLVIPTNEVRRTKRDLVAKSQKPTALGKKIFVMKTKSGREVLAMRIGKGKRKRYRFMYNMIHQAQIQPILHFIESIGGFVQKNANEYMTRALERALRG